MFSCCSRFIVGFNTVATFEADGYKKHLVHSGYRYYRNGAASKDTCHWLCVDYYRNKCKARATTKTIGDVEMVRFNSEHSHAPLIPTFYQWAEQ